ncbi:MAG: hypothetical protein IPK59_05265 [Rhodospirillaceae bacterium]|nr:hypothetical protein [Rhodospirillaceae bacterium]
MSNMVSSTRQLIYALVAVLTGAMLISGNARADTYFKFVRVTCVPEADYAAIETLGLYNVGGEERAALAAQGIFEICDLDKHPYACKLSHGALSIELINYHAPQPTGQCGGVEDGDLLVTLAGQELTRATSTHGGCTGFRQHEIRISRYAPQHCITRFDDIFEIATFKGFLPVNKECKSIPLNN